MMFLKLFTLLLLFCENSGIKLNYPRVLLPIFDKVAINFTLEIVEKGCFKWSSSRQDLITINAIYDDQNSECTSRAIVTPISTEKHRNTAIVLAEDLSTGEILRCDVILDLIDNLRVLTTTRELYLEEAPETFVLCAFDSQGNAFTTLEGIEFNWQITSQNYRNLDSNDKINWQQVLRFLSFSESPYHEVPKSVKNFDFLGLKGYMVLLEGINSGTAKVTVRLPYEEYSSVPAIDVDIMVLANIIVDPIDAYILVGDTVQFRILQLKKGKMQEVSSNTQYYLEIEDTNYATINDNLVKGTVLGRTSVILRDRNVPSNRLNDLPNTPSPRASLTITSPSRITLNLLPYYNWATIEGEQHEIAADLYTHDDNKIILGSKYKISSQFDERLFHIIAKNQNGSRIFGEAVQIGSSRVSANFEDLKTEAELIVYNGIELIPSVVVLPFDPNQPKRQKVQFTATGGDGSFVWSSLNQNLVAISQNGLADTRLDNLNTADFSGDTKKMVKFAQIKVAMKRNNKLSKIADLLFLPPVKLEIVKYNFETPYHDYVHIHIAVYTYYNNTYIPYTSCDNLYFELDFSNEIFHSDNKNVDKIRENNACRLISLRATALGSTNLKVSYSFLDKVLKDEVSLVVFEKLEILNPLSNEIVLPIGSSRNVIYHNGPQKVFNIEADFSKSVHFDRSIVGIEEIDNQFSKDKHIFNVLCRKIGETSLKLDIFNTLTTDNYVPYVSQYITNIYCVKPRFINLYTTEKLRQSCPLKLKNSFMHVKRNDANLEVGIEILDAQNRKLMNITSLLLDWQFAQVDGKFDGNVVHTREVEEEIVAGVRIPVRDYLITSIPDVQYNLKIKASVSTYNAQLLKSFSIYPESPEFGVQKMSGGPVIKPVIENELNFLAVNSTLLPYDTLSIYLAKDRTERIPISQGSGFYEIVLSESGIINVELDDATKELVISPIRTGHVKIELVDRCLLTDPSHLYVNVVTIGKIEVQVPDRVEKTKSIEAIAKLYDSMDHLLVLDSKNLGIYELHENVFNVNTLSVKLDKQINLNVGEIRYIVSGLALGETKVIFYSGYGDLLIESIPVTIQVFPSLKLYPKNITVVIGSTAQIYAQGGPHPDVNIVYSVQNENIVSMDSAVAAAIKLGDTKIIGQCVGISPTTGQQIIFSQDFVHIYVVPLDKVTIKTPLVRIKSGAVMPASIWGVPDISPMVLGTLPSLSVIWSTNQPDVISIIGMFSDAGIEYSANDAISVRIKALNPGKANIQAIVVTSTGKQTTFVEVTVFKMLELELPKRITSDTILIPPKSSINLKANLIDVIYQLDADNNGVIKVSKDGIVKSGEAIGRDLIIASSMGQTLSIPVEVKNIHYVLATLQSPSVKLKHSENNIPRGMNIIIKITLHDNLGNEFSHNLEDINNLKHKLSRKEMADIHVGGNFTIGINLPRVTSGMLSVSLKETSGVKYAEDYIKLSVAQSHHIFPTKTIFSVGDIICFDSPLTYSSNWISSDDTVIVVDNNLGIGRVLSSRSKFGEKVTVINGDQHFGHIKYEMDIREADKIEFLKTYDIFNGENYRGHLLIRNHLQVDKSSNLISKNMTTCKNSIGKMPANFFTCKLKLLNQHSNKVLDNFKTISIFDKQFGSYACEIQLLTSINELIEAVKNTELNLELEAQLSNGILDTVHLKMVPAIEVFPQTIGFEQLSQQVITITGLDKVLQKVEVKSSDTSLLEITQISKSHGTLQYKAKQLNNFNEAETLSIKVNSPLTQQIIEIAIQPSHLISKCSTQPLHTVSNFLNFVSNFGLIISAMIVLAISVWVFVYCFPQRQRSDPNNQIFLSQEKNNVQNMSPIHPSAFVSTRGQLYLNTSSPNSTNVASSNGDSPVYGDSTLISPQRRIHPRFL